ncbi:GyrI-like domain-containing protein [Catenuloplanes atrovinosus]|uniref:GyrI-like small molecule binding domain-containing protein n=1 Tax=Catenuloplanes atrovinosus TaxID=137266 RepID=A0AAE3YM50_9ACTN|nr:GyrI-like domain-containing protein [Catenuloplanes atrovinosus]MDR7275557.1 hypothetical protein [Catenuloplanes atrovinosus]
MGRDGDATKIDFKRTLDAYRATRGRFRLVDVPAMRYLMADGQGDPNTSPAFTAAVEALYPVAYRLKFFSKTELGRDYVVPPLEGLWWADDMDAFTAARDKSRWSWTLMIMVPDWIDEAMIPAAGGVRVETLAEGRCVQTLHVGAFDDEAAVLARMHDEFIPGEGLRMTGRHHEVYFSDFRRVPPERRRTLLRQPVAP